MLVLFCGTWDDAGEDVAEGRAPVLPVISLSAPTCRAFSASLAQADANMFCKANCEKQINDISEQEMQHNVIW